MRLHPLLTFIRSYPLRLVLSLDREATRFYRATFLAALVAQPFAKQMASEKMSLSTLCGLLDLAEPCPELEAWLDLGVSLNLLSRSGQRFGIRSRLARRLVLGPDAWCGFYRTRTEIFHNYILDTPALLVRGERLEIEDRHGELYAQSSRTVEPVLIDVAHNYAKAAPSKCTVLEVGCGSGCYIHAAAQANPDLRFIGLEPQASIASLARENMRKWNLTKRVEILDTGLMEYNGGGRYGIVTLHNLIYYFPMGQRKAILLHLRDLLSPGGLLVITTMVRSSLPGIRAMNLWTIMNKNSGPLPGDGEVERILGSTGFTDICSRELIPSFRLVTARSRIPEKDKLNCDSR